MTTTATELDLPWNRWIPWKPTSKQLAALLCYRYRELMYGGAVGGGKTVELLMDASLFLHVPGYSALLLRKSYADLTQPDCLIPLSHQWWGDTGATWNEKKKLWTFPSGATLGFGYLDSPKDKYRYQGAAYQFIGFDEVAEHREEDYRFLFSRLRRPSGMDVPVRMRATANPIGPGFEWVRRRFIVEAGDDPDRVFIPSALEDNPHLDTEEYEKGLEELDPVTRKKLKNGDWSENLRKGDLFERRFIAGQIRENEKVAELERICRFWDFAATEQSDDNPDPDWCVGLLMGLDTDGRVWVLDVERFRAGPDEVEKRIQNVAARDGRKTPIVLELEPGSQSKISHSYFARRVLQGYDVHSSKPTKNKEERARPFASQWRQRNVYLVRGTWNGEFLDELEGFPHGGHDDQVDAASGAFGHLVSEYVKKPSTWSAKRIL